MENGKIEIVLLMKNCNENLPITCNYSLFNENAINRTSFIMHFVMPIEFFTRIYKFYISRSTTFHTRVRHATGQPDILLYFPLRKLVVYFSGVESGEIEK